MRKVISIIALVIVILIVPGVWFLQKTGRINISFKSNEIKPITSGKLPKEVAVKGYEAQPAVSYGIYRQTPEVKGLYISEWTLSSAANQEKWINVCKEKEVNALVINVKNDDGKIAFTVDSEVAKQIGADNNAPIKNPEELILKLKQNGIFPIARIVAFKDPYLAEKRPDLSIKDRSGNVLRIKTSSGRLEAWVNPYNREVWEYVVDIAKEAEKVGFDEIQFDYIRFATGSGMSNAYMGPESDTKDYKQIVLEFTQYAVDELKPLGVYVSADVFGTIITSEVDARIVGQNYVEMSKILDYICPMIYPSHYNNGALGVQYPDLDPYQTIYRALEESNKLLNTIPEGEHRAIVRPWLQDFTATWVKPYQVYGPKQIREQIKATYDTGLKEWILWNASNKYTLDGLLDA